MAPKRTIGLLSVAFLVSLSMANMVQSPLRIRVNSELLKGVFHKKDQDLLKLFENLNLGDYDLSSSHKIKDLTISLLPKSGSTDEFDYNLSLDMKSFIGLESKDLKLTGKGSIQHGDDQNGGEVFTIEGPINSFRLEAELTQEDGTSSKNLALKELDFKLDFETTVIESASNAFQEHGHAAELKTWIQSRLVQEVKAIKDKVIEGDQDTISKLPILSLAPVFGLFYATYGAEKVTFSDTFVEYDFSPISLKLVDRLHNEFLKEIDTKFVDDEQGAQPSAVQLIIDENLVNGVVGQFLKIEKMYSLREFMSLDPRFIVFRQLLTSTTLGMVLPSFKEEYGEGRPLDLVGTASHDFINSGLGGDVNPSGLKIDKNGNFHFQINLGAQLVVENRQGVWEEGRSIYASFQIKGKMFVADPTFENRTFVILPKGVQLSTLKILKGDQEQFLEQMLIQSMVGFQLDQVKKAFQPVVIPLKKFPNPTELQCLGFNLTNVDIKVNKGYIQLNGNYVKIDKPDNETACLQFEEMVTRSPKAIFNKITQLPGIGKLASDKFGLGDGELPKKRKETGKPHEEVELKADL